ncbi:hypothetical protein V6N13_023825 [Hibiscus sabdariffa]
MHDGVRVCSTFLLPFVGFHEADPKAMTSTSQIELLVISKNETEDKETFGEVGALKQGNVDDQGIGSKSPRRSWADVVQRNLEP